MTRPRPETAVRRFIEAHHDELVAFRRHLHAYPEPSFQERETTDLVAQRLSAAGLAPRLLASGCGLVCDIPASPADGAGRRTVALRADLDALEMDDEKTVSYRSQRPGVAHACGHDVHTTVVLGAGLALADLARSGALPGTVRLIFEPGEETLPPGAVAIIDAGALDGVASIYGVHCDPKLDAGRVAVRTGALTSASDIVDLDLHGPGGHTARPHLTVDLVRVAGRVVTELPDLVQTRATAAGLGDVLVVFGMLAAGHAANVIPAHARLRATVRTPDRAVWERSEQLVADALDELLRPTGASWRTDYIRGIPPVTNDAAETARVARVARALVGAEHVDEAPQSFGGDSFAWYVEQIPGSYTRLGVHDPARGEDAQLDLHSSTFDVDERAIAIGAQLLALTALDALQGTPVPDRGTTPSGDSATSAPSANR
jgi:amidohydrolase